MTGERDLIAAILHVAVQDVLRPPSDASSVDHQNARAFCLDMQGSWRESREILCMSIDINPDVFRASVIDKMERVQRRQKGARASVAA